MDNMVEMEDPILLAEQAVLGSLIVDGELFDMADSLSVMDFKHHAHCSIFESISQLISDNSPVDIITVAEHLEKNGRLIQLGGLAYLSALTDAIPGATVNLENLEKHIEMVLEDSIKRKIQSLGDSLRDGGVKQSSQSLIEDIQARVQELEDRRTAQQQGLVQIDPILTQSIEHIQGLYERKDYGAISGLPTGFIDLDLATSGFRPGQLIILAARPVMGKTALALNLAESAALQSDKHVAVFSMEMSSVELTNRLIGSIGRINGEKLTNGNLEDRDWEKMSYALSKLKESKIHIDETAALNIAQLRSRLNKLKKKVGEIGLVVIDYLQLMGSISRPGRNDNRATELGEITRSLKGLAKEFGCPIVALSQLNRSLEARTNRRPIMSDLRESGAIEQDADLILFIYRDEVYNADSEDKGIAEIIIGKQRNGRIGTIKTAFIGEYTRFENLQHKSSNDYF